MDNIRRFLFKELNVRGQHIQLDNAWKKMIAERHYPAVIINLLGELTAVTTMLAAGLKHQGKVTIQVQGSGPVNLLVVEATNELNIKGVAKTTEQFNAILNDELDLNQLLGDGKILVTLENKVTDSIFQSYVPREADTIKGIFEDFLTRSDQQPSKLWLAANEMGVGGVLIQKLPASENIDADGWNRIEILSDTLTKQEIISLDSETLIHTLFHEELIELFDGEDIQYYCPKDTTKIETMLLSLGKEECLKIIEEQGEIVIHNEMCNFHVRYQQQDINNLFAQESTN